MKIQPLRGTHDLFGEQLYKYKKIEEVIKKFANIYSFDEIITPIFESTELFQKPLGEHSDVVLKEMYTFNDKNDSSLTLRPEYTTPMLRASISNNLLEKLPQKLYGLGPMFRRERPQKGRYRQFNQINFEILGTYDVMGDVELIILANNILKSILPNNQIYLQLNSLGNKDTLKKFKSELSEYFFKYKSDLSEESKNKINTNPLRILDSKETNEIEINKNAPKISDYYSIEANKIFSDIQNLLTKSSINYKINPNLVRGLDYYCHTVFEFKSNELGSQDTLIGGGRYDGLIKVLGGPDIPGVGWAGGVERLIMLMNDFITKHKTVYLIIINEDFKEYGLQILNLLRNANINAHFDYKYNLKKSLSSANDLNAKFALIIGEEEVKEKMCTIKNLQKKTQEKISINQIINFIN